MVSAVFHSPLDSSVRTGRQRNEAVPTIARAEHACVSSPP